MSFSRLLTCISRRQPLETVSDARFYLRQAHLADDPQINAKDRASQFPLHRAASTGSNAFLQLLLNPPEGRPKTRLNGADRAGKPSARKSLVHIPCGVSSALYHSPRDHRFPSTVTLPGAIFRSITYKLAKQTDADLPGNTPLHLAMESGHGAAAVTLIEAGVDRERVSDR
jgi:ankyrin repeat protein